MSNTSPLTAFPKGYRPKPPNTPPRKWVVLAFREGSDIEFLTEIIGLYFNKTRDETVQLVADVTNDGWAILVVTTFEIAESRYCSAIAYAKRHMRPVNLVLVPLENAWEMGDADKPLDDTAKKD